MDGEGVRHRVYSQDTTGVDGPFFAILWLDCDECSAPRTNPVRAIWDRVNAP